VNFAEVRNTSKPRPTFGEPPNLWPGVVDVSSVLVAKRLLTVEGCTGTWQLDIEGNKSPQGDKGNPYLDSVPGQFPALVMHEHFEPDRGCADWRQLRCSSPYVVSFSDLQADP